MVTSAAERKAVAHLVVHHGMSERRACKAIGRCRMTVRYKATRPDDGVLRERMKAIAHERRRFGYRRLHVILKREGFVVNHKRLFRLYREERLTVRRRGGRKRAMGTRRPIETPQAPNQRWSLDFVSDQLTDGRRFRILAVVDDCTWSDASDWRSWRTAPFPGAGSRGNWMPSSASESCDQTRSSATTARSTPRTPSCNGRINRASAGTTSRPASLSRTALSRASTAACATSCSMRRCSDPSPMPAPP